MSNTTADNLNSLLLLGCWGLFVSLTYLTIHYFPLSTLLDVVGITLLTFGVSSTIFISGFMGIQYLVNHPDKCGLTGIAKSIREDSIPTISTVLVAHTSVFTGPIAIPLYLIYLLLNSIWYSTTTIGSAVKDRVAIERAKSKQYRLDRKREAGLLSLTNDN